MYNIPESMKLSKNFEISEFACKDGSKVIMVDYELVDLLQKMRDTLGKPIRVTSGYRTVSFNKKCGGTATSHHLTGKAADIKVAGLSPLDLAFVADKFGFRGIGVYPTFTHVDVGPNKLYWLQNTAGVKKLIKSLDEAK